MKPTEIYFCYLNGQFYGRGTLDFMRELFVDYVITNKIYGKNEVTFQIFKEGEAK